MAPHTDDPALPPAEDRSGEDLPLIELETLLSRPPSRRKRLAQIGFVLVAVVVLAAFWRSIAPDKPVPAAPALAPTPAASPPMLLILSNINYGSATVNGKKQPGQLPMLVPLRGDTYNITLNAQPFLPKSCRIRLSQPGSPDNNPCLVHPTPPNDFVTYNDIAVAPAFVLEISLTLNDLPPAQQHALTAMLAQALTYRQDLTVPAGSFIAASVLPSGQITSQRVAAPVRASATVAPFTPQRQDVGLPCAGFICTGGFETQSASTGAYLSNFWNILVSVALRWRFSDPSGMVKNDVQFQSGNTLSLALSYHPAQGWSIYPASPAVDTSNNQVTDTFCSTGESILGQFVQTGSSITIGTSHDQGAQGCEMVLDVNAIDQGLYLWRFGVLLAADKQARAAHPELPVAPPDEIAAVEQP